MEHKPTIEAEKVSNTIPYAERPPNPIPDIEAPICCLMDMWVNTLEVVWPSKLDTTFCYAPCGTGHVPLQPDHVTSIGNIGACMTSIC